MSSKSESNFFGADFSGFDALMDELQGYIEKTDEESVFSILEIGADSFVKDLLKLPKPKSKIAKAGYTHLVKTFSYKRNQKQIEVGWGKYYGPMVERGTRTLRAQPHLTPLWERNKEKYYQEMVNKFKR